MKSKNSKPFVIVTCQIGKRIKLKSDPIYDIEYVELYINQVNLYLKMGALSGLNIKFKVNHF
jgi:hypothetical protein